MAESNQTAPANGADQATDETKAPKAKRLTQILLAICILVFTWYVFADRWTPYSDQARINSLAIPVVSQVAGYLSDVRIQLHSVVNEGDTLFVVDQRKYEYAVRQAEANVDRTSQSVGSGTASVKAAAAQLGSARARLDRAQRNFDRTQKVIQDNPGALSQADLDRAETSLAASVEGVAGAEANLEKAKEALGATGPENADLRLALAQLESAQLDLSLSNVIVPYSGIVESFNLDVGYFAAAGAPLATLVTAEDVWIQANMRENNLSNIKIGDPVEISLDVAPGKIINGRVRSLGYGVSNGRNSNPGDLPSIQAPTTWLRDPQRFPVIIDFNIDDPHGLRRVGGQADVIVYTGQNPILNAIGWLEIRIASWLSYVR